MLLSFAFYAVKSYRRHKKNPKYYSFTFFDIWDDVSESATFCFGAMTFLVIVLIVIIAGVYTFLMTNL